MIFIKVNENNDVTYTHNMPFDIRYGLNKTKEQLLQEGYLVEEIPDFPDKEGKYRVIKYTESLGFTCEYIDRPLTPEEEITQLKQKNAELESAIMELTIALGGDA